MSDQRSHAGLEVRSKVSPDNKLVLSLERVEVGEPAPDEIIVRIDAAPINPSDMAMLLGPGDPANAVEEGEGENKKLIFPLLPGMTQALTPRMDLSLCPGLEGAGVVVDAGNNCKDLIGRTVSMFGGEMFAQYRKINPKDCLIFPEGTHASKCASSFVNPLTALGIVDTLHREGHKALIHTAAASNVGQMLVKLCNEDGIDLINIVRNQEQVNILKDLGARYICDSTSPNFVAELTEMIRETGATLAFDAISGGTLASTIVVAMESVYAPKDFYIYGSSVHKQIYIYGILNPSPIEFSRLGAGTAWGVSGWLMMNYLDKIGLEATQKMKDRVVRQFDTIFTTPYTAEIPLSGALDVTTLLACRNKSTGEKYLLTPNKTD